MLRLPSFIGFKSKRTRRLAWVAGGLLVVFALQPGGGPVVLTLASHDAPREALHEIIPLFRKHWLDRTGHRVVVRASYRGSGAQSRAVAAGFAADVAVFSLDSDMVRLEKAGLITHDWRKGWNGGMVAGSAVVLAVRDGNPRNIRGWGDLARKNLDILTHNPKTSGTPWNFLALYGSADRGAAAPYGGGDEGAFRFCRAVFKNVRVMDADARGALLRFERGLGDAVVTDENEMLSRPAGLPGDKVVPRSTVLIQFPAAVVDVYADRHGARPEAEAFRDFLLSFQAQEVFARHGFRPVDRTALFRNRGKFPPIPDAWTVEDYGGWSEVGSVFFGPGGLFDSVMEETRAAP